MNEQSASNVNERSASEDKLELYDIRTMLFWLLMDGFWHLEFIWLALCFALCALAYNLATFRYIQKSFVVLSLAGAGTLWICMNITSLVSDRAPLFGSISTVLFVLCLVLVCLSRVKSKTRKAFLDAADRFRRLCRGTGTSKA